MCWNPVTRLKAARLRRRARAAARTGDWTDAARDYRRLAASGGATANDRIQLGHALKQSNDWIGAGEAYRAAATACPRDPDAHRQHALFLRADGRPDEAAAALLRARVLAPGDESVRADLASLGIEEDEIDERMIAALLGAADGRVSSPPWRSAASLYRRAARRHARAGRWHAAERDYRAILAADSHQPGVLIQLGHALSEQGDPAGAVAVYRLALLCRPRVAEPWLHLGHALKRLERPVAAQQAYLAAWRLQPGFAPAGGELRAAGWSDEGLAALAAASWAGAEADDAGSRRLAPSAGLSRGERATWAFLAAAVGSTD